MRKTSVVLILICILIGNIYCSSNNNKEDYEREEREKLEFNEKQEIPKMWKEVEEINLPKDFSNLKIEFLIALKYRNMDSFNDRFERITNPKNPSYGNYFTREQIRDLIGATPQTIQSLSHFLEAYSLKIVKISFDNSYVKVAGTIESINEAFKIKLKAFQHKEREREVIIKSLEPASIPISLFDKIDLLSGLFYFPIENLKGPKTKLSSPFINAPNPNIGPLQLRQRYNVTDLGGLAMNNTQAVAEFQEQYYAPSDLSSFFSQFVNYANQTTVYKVVGTNVPSVPGVESSLDIEYIMGVNPKTRTFFYITEGSFWDAMVAWADELSDESSPPLVHSISYGWQFFGKPSDTYKNRLSSDFQKITSRGISIIFASGDYGAGCDFCFELSASFPATIPYVTSVGATRFINGAVGPEEAVIEFKSGGGFSRDFSRPDWQNNAVEHYFSVAKDLPSSLRYNKNGRSTPDVAALGIGFQIVVEGSVEIVGGTSASAPTFAAIISLLNDQRLSKGKAPLGFLNPWIYQSALNPGAFYDVTIGDNPHSCCLVGFHCAVGYDPVTGYGTPNYQILKTLI